MLAPGNRGLGKSIQLDVFYCPNQHFMRNIIRPRTNQVIGKKK